MDVSEWFTLKSNFVDQWAYEKSGESKPVKRYAPKMEFICHTGERSCFLKKLLQNCGVFKMPQILYLGDSHSVHKLAKIFCKNY